MRLASKGVDGFTEQQKPHRLRLADQFRQQVSNAGGCCTPLMDTRVADQCESDEAKSDIAYAGQIECASPNTSPCISAKDGFMQSRAAP